MPLTTDTIFAARYPYAEGTDREKENITKLKHSIYKKKRKKIHKKKLHIELLYSLAPFLFRRRFSSWTLALSLRNVDIACRRASEHSSTDGTFCLRNNSGFLTLVSQ
jgi:hypothetical protein